MIVKTLLSKDQGRDRNWVQDNVSLFYNLLYYKVEFRKFRFIIQSGHARHYLIYAGVAGAVLNADATTGSQWG